MTAVFHLSGYYNGSVAQVLAGVTVLLVCGGFSLLLLKGLNGNTEK